MSQFPDADPWRKRRRTSEPINIRERPKPDVEERSPVSSSVFMRRKAFEERELGRRPRTACTTPVKNMFAEGAFVLPGLEEHFLNRADYDSVEEEDHWKFIEEADASGNARYHYEHHILTKEEREQGRIVRTGRWRRPKVLSILVLEKLGDRLPLDKPANLRMIEYARVLVQKFCVDI
ncbi:MAG TPA: hypothetical protein VGO47_05995 [Chlamydiales bacterium]|nr:hypothetical protein [Chlamydiales bacterium]